jgi:hypothetical protein
VAVAHARQAARRIEEAISEILHVQLRSHLTDFVAAYNFAKRLKTLKGLTPYEFICKAWTKEPERFTLRAPNRT